MKLALLLSSILFIASCSPSNSSKTNSPTNEEPSDYSVDIAGAIIEVNGLVISDDSLTFGSTSLSEKTKTKTLEIKNSSNVAVKASIAMAADTGFSIKLNRCAAILLPGSKCLLTLSFTSRGLFNGQSSGQVVISYTDLGGQTVVPVAAEVTQQPNPNTLEPSLSYTLAPFQSGSGNTRDLVISNAGPGDANNLSVVLPASYAVWVTRCPSTLKAHLSCTITIINKLHRTSAPVAGEMQVIASSPQVPVIKKYVDMRTAVVGDLPSGGGGPVDPPVVTATTVSIMPANEKTLDTIPGLNLTLSTSYGHFYESNNMVQNIDPYVLLTCDSSMNGEYIELFVANDGLSEIRALNRMPFASIPCGYDGYLPNGGYFSVGLSRKIYNESLIVVAVRKDQNTGEINGEKVFEFQNEKLFTSPPKLSINTMVRFELPQSGTQYYAVGEGAASLATGYAVNNDSYLIESLSSWTTCSAYINESPGQSLFCHVDQNESGGDVLGIKYLKIRDEGNHMMCGNLDGVLTITFCNNMSTLCETSTISYRPPQCPPLNCGQYSSEVNGQCQCDDGYADTSSLNGTNCQPISCGNYYDQNSCSNAPAGCSWIPYDFDFPENGGSCN